MAHWRRQPVRMLDLAAGLFSLLLVQNASGFPFHTTSANLSPRMVYHNLGSLVGVVLTESRHIVKDLETLYELRQLALGTSPAEGSSVPISLSSSSPSSVQEAVCNYRAIPGPSGAKYRCLLFRPDSTRFSSVPRC